LDQSDKTDEIDEPEVSKDDSKLPPIGINSITLSVDHVEGLNIKKGESES
jgi:hypothetical protein